MTYLTDQDLDDLDAFARGTGGPGDGLGLLTTLEGVLALCRAYRR